MQSMPRTISSINNANIENFLVNNVETAKYLLDNYRLYLDAKSVYLQQLNFLSQNCCYQIHQNGGANQFQVNNYFVTFSALDLFETVAHYLTSEIATGIFNKNLAGEKIMYADLNPVVSLQKFLEQLQLLHCELAKTINECPQMTIWTKCPYGLFTNKPAPSDKAGRNYSLGQAISATELRELYVSVLSKFSYSQSKIVISYEFFCSQILKLLSTPLGIYLLKKFVAKAGEASIILEGGDEFAVDYKGDFNVISQKDTQFPYKFKTTPGEDYRLIVASKNTISRNRFSTTIIPNNSFVDQGLYWGVDKNNVIKIGSAPYSISLAHEIRHLINFLNCKAAFQLGFPADKDYASWWTNLEEYRTITYLSCCENAFLAERGLPYRTSHHLIYNVENLATMERTEIQKYKAGIESFQFSKPQIGYDLRRYFLNTMSLPSIVVHEAA